MHDDDMNEYTIQNDHEALAIVAHGLIHDVRYLLGCLIWFLAVIAAIGLSGAVYGFFFSEEYRDALLDLATGALAVAGAKSVHKRRSKYSVGSAR